MEEATKFYEWMLKIKSIHLSDNNSMNKAFHRVYKDNKNEEVSSMLLDRT
jgi:hypothetical protein